jgi:hypothetical protein
MKPKIQLKDKVRILRKQGLSYREILQKVPVAKSSVSIWCRDIKLTTKQQNRLMNKWRAFVGRGPKATAKRRKKEIQCIKRSAKTEIQRLTPYTFKIGGAILYWAEGSKNGSVVISNSDPRLIKFMVDWFEKIHKISPKKLKARLNIHKNQNDIKIKKYWSRITRIPLKNFGKSYIKPEGTGHRKNILHNGVIRIGVGNENLRYRIMGWIERLYLDIHQKT